MLICTLCIIGSSRLVYNDGFYFLRLFLEGKRGNEMVLDSATGGHMPGSF